MPTYLTPKHFTFFERDISQFSLPEHFTYPFCYEAHPLALAASEELQQKLLHFHPVNSEQKGRMYGVLVVKDVEGNIGYLSALSGNATEKESSIRTSTNKDCRDENSADVNSTDKNSTDKNSTDKNSSAGISGSAINFVPTIYKAYNQSEFEQSQQVIINDINAKIDQLSNNTELARLATLIAAQEKNAQEEVKALQQQMRDNKKARKDKRDWLNAAELPEALSVKAHRDISISLSRASVEDKKSLQALKLHHQLNISDLQSRLALLTDDIAALKKRRKNLSAKLQKHFFKQYKLLNINLEHKDLTQIFSGTLLQKPPAGSGDCAAPKLLQYAFEHNLTPVCMAEFWWGQQPSSEIRKHRHFYPACQSKCLPILTHMLEGMDVDKNPLLINPAENVELEIVFQDEHVVVVNKPSGLLSVPGKSIQDSVYTRIQALFPWATGGLIIHRLDMATSGLLMLSLNERAHKHLQQQFINKEVSKRYVAVIDTVLTKQSGEICLPLRGDFDDRPKQMVCHEFGKYAETHWEIIEEKDKRTKLFLYPITGRTHQLRMHCAHPDGLNTPIIGDTLYGTPANRLHLHAQRLSFTHPITKEKLTFEVKEEF